ncbi:MAG: 16S rRNA (uracil(1498)-N(3))-methyltransferase [Acetobacteraceae bacterium]|nr:16S rRNA (uracil(1498)-N(3))-methyltransferase [Acetobacteraceae bacterium]MDW8398268.1 16S rRNA (uracil(1498)-N(3))-methyltransferase [Acetobacteraceae bacterium]
MSIPRLFTEADLAEGAEFPAAEGQGAYLAQVLRRRPGDAVRLFNGRDGEWEGRLASLARDRAVLRAERRIAPQRGVPDIALLLAVLKREAMEAAVQAAVELGAARIVPVLAARSVPDRVNVARLSLIAREAAEQCERMEVPEVAAPVPFAAALERWGGAPLILAAERRSAPPLPAAAAGLAPPLGLMVGPEGGFTPAELDAALARPFVVPATLGPRILRARTAVAAGLAVLMAAAGDWNQSQG